MYKAIFLAGELVTVRGELSAPQERGCEAPPDGTSLRKVFACTGTFPSLQRERGKMMRALRNPGPPVVSGH